jgi:hypothetical protein
MKKVNSLLHDDKPEANLLPTAGTSVVDLYFSLIHGVSMIILYLHRYTMYRQAYSIFIDTQCSSTNISSSSIDTLVEDVHPSPTWGILVVIFFSFDIDHVVRHFHLESSPKFFQLRSFSLHPLVRFFRLSMIKHFKSDWMTDVDYLLILIDVMSQSQLSIIIILESLFVSLASFHYAYHTSMYILCLLIL